jgi:transglutaminase-like putative cysteine protease
MYLVEIEAGREELFESVDSLGAAIRRGDVGPRSRIFHRASSSWISITLHPEFKKAAAAVTSAPLASEPLPPLARKQWTFYGVEPIAREIHEAPAPESTAPEPAPADAGERRGLSGLLARAFRNISPSPRAPEPSGS